MYLISFDIYLQYSERISDVEKELKDLREEVIIYYEVDLYWCKGPIISSEFSKLLLLFTIL
jgi:hypothetical protein